MGSLDRETQNLEPAPRKTLKKDRAFRVLSGRLRVAWIGNSQSGTSSTEDADERSSIPILSGQLRVAWIGNSQSGTSSTEDADERSSIPILSGRLRVACIGKLTIWNQLHRKTLKKDRTVWSSRFVRVEKLREQKIGISFCGVLLCTLSPGFAIC